MNKKKVFLVIIALTSLYSCKKELAITDPAIRNELEVQGLDFEFLNTKSRITYQDQDTDISVTATIRIKKDSVIWLSLSPAFGIEAARGMITRDSIKFMNRLTREYTVYDFGALSEKYNFNITFDLIQSMLLGVMPKNASEKDKIIKRNDHYIIKQVQGPVAIDNYIGMDLMKLEKVQMADKPTDNTLTLQYEDFQRLKENVFPFQSSISLNYREGNELVSTLINIDHAKAEVSTESLSFPFNIPQKYERK